MGIFGSKYKTTVSTTVSRVIEDKILPDSIKAGVIAASLQSGNISDYVLEELSSSLGLTFGSYYKYGKNQYVNGLPSGSFLKSNSCKNDVEAVLSSLEGMTLTTTYCNYGPPNGSHIGWLKAIELYGLNTETNELMVLSAAKGFPVYMQDLQYVVPTSKIPDIHPMVIEQWGTSPNTGYTPKRTMGSVEAGSLGKYSAVIHDTGATDDYFILTYVWEEVTVTGTVTTKTKIEESTSFANDFYVDSANYFQARYLKNGKPKYFMYADDAGIHPSLDDFYTTENTTAGTFFPFAYFRYNKVSIDTDKNSQDYITNKKLTKIIGLDYDELITKINENPDIGYVEQAMLMLGVPATTTDKYEQQYLFDFFKSVYSALEVANPTANTTPDFSSLEALIKSGKSNSNNGAGSVPMSSMVIQDKKFKMSLNHSGIYRNLVVGSIGVKGTCTSEVIASNIPQTFKNLLGTVLTTVLPESSHIYRKQITDHIYEEYTVRGLKTTYHIYGEYSVTADETDDILLIPVDKSITDTYSLRVREQLFSRAFHFVFNARVVTEIKWYQTGVFKVILIIAAIVISYFTGGAGAALVSAAAAGAVTTVVMILIEMLLWQLLFAYVFKLFVKLVGIKVAFVLAIVAAMAGVYISLDSVAGASNFWADALIQVSTGLTAAGSKYIQEEMNDLLGEMSAYEKEMKKELETLDEKILALDGTIHLNPFIVFGETPDEFYNRTIHAGNIGMLGVDVVANYVAIQLKLPDISTVEQFQGA